MRKSIDSLQVKLERLDSVNAVLDEWAGFSAQINATWRRGIITDEERSTRMLEVREWTRNAIERIASREWTFIK